MNTTTPPTTTAAAPTLTQLRERHHALFGDLSAHGWDAVGVPRQRGSTTFVQFRHGGTGDELELAEGELPFWLAQLDESQARQAALKARPANATAGRTKQRTRRE